MHRHKLALPIMESDHAPLAITPMLRPSGPPKCCRNDGKAANNFNQKDDHGDVNILHLPQSRGQDEDQSGGWLQNNSNPVLQASGVAAV